MAHIHEMEGSIPLLATKKICEDKVFTAFLSGIAFSTDLVEGENYE